MFVFCDDGMFVLFEFGMFYCGVFGMFVYVYCVFVVGNGLFVCW